MHNILTDYPVQFRKPAGCGIDYSRLFGEVLGDQRGRVIEVQETAKKTKRQQCSTEKVQNAREELHIHADSRKREICTASDLSACLQRTEAYAGFQEQGEEIGDQRLKRCWEQARLH